MPPLMEFSQAFIQICICFFPSVLMFEVFIVLILRFFLLNFPIPFPMPIIFFFFSVSFFVPLVLFDRCARAQCNDFLRELCLYSSSGSSSPSLFFDLSRVCDRASTHKTMEVHCAPHTANNCLECNLCYCFDGFRVSKNSRVSDACDAHVFRLPSTWNRNNSHSHKDQRARALWSRDLLISFVSEYVSTQFRRRIRHCCRRLSTTLGKCGRGTTECEVEN